MVKGDNEFIAILFEAFEDRAMIDDTGFAIVFDQCKVGKAFTDVLFVFGMNVFEVTVNGEPENTSKGGVGSFSGVIAQIVVLDLVFSIDSVLTAIGLAEHLFIMITAVVIAMAVMLTASKPISEFIYKHPTSKMLALCFLLVVGIVLVADGMHIHIPRAYLYAAIAFSIVVEALNLLMKRNSRK